ncbi:hypothetical protein [Mesorhizobium sp.]|uniref:hypothetical protein n=1 Tax=Mesorhizobium sp. TaxID=1871066 RepID=UPI000FE8CA11|nr:hypothetical protein [Mesorhizobium sp.]RWK47034.1 MAG: hypothetical protein EOR48_32735 [Mesorhizobium sp.]
MFQPHLKASIRHAFKVPVRFDPDLIATEGETFFVGLGSLWVETVEAFAAKAAYLEGDGGLSTKSQSET